MEVIALSSPKGWHHPKEDHLDLQALQVLRREQGKPSWPHPTRLSLSREGGSTQSRDIQSASTSPVQGLSRCDYRAKRRSAVAPLQ